jgi:hypothetical protein
LRQKDELLCEIVEKLIACYPIDPYMHLSAEPSKDAIEELSRDLEERLLLTMPPIEPWDYLDDLIYHVLESAWPEGLSDALLGSSEYDNDHAQALLDGIEEIAKEYGFPEPPWFELKDMLEFMHAWRDRIVEVIEKEKRKKIRYIHPAPGSDFSNSD